MEKEQFKISINGFEKAKIDDEIASESVSLTDSEEKLDKFGTGNHSVINEETDSENKSGPKKKDERHKSPIEKSKTSVKPIASVMEKMGNTIAAAERSPKI